MPWDSKYSDYGVVRVEGRKVKVYSDQDNYTPISLSEIVSNAVWAGGELNISLKSGKVRRYRDKYNYTTI